MCGRLLLEAETNRARKSLPFLNAVFMDHCRAPSNDRGTRKKAPLCLLLLAGDTNNNHFKPVVLYLRSQN